MRTMIYIYSALLVLLALSGCGGGGGSNRVATSLASVKLSISPDTGVNTMLYKLTADGLNDHGQPVANVKARWDFDGDGNFDTPYQACATAMERVFDAGTYTVKAEAQDANGNTVTAVKTLTVDANDPYYQAAVFPQVTPTEGTTDTLFTYSFIAFEPFVSRADQLSRYGDVRWDWEDDGIYDTPFIPYQNLEGGDPNPYPPVITHQFSTTGEKTTRVMVRVNMGIEQGYGYATQTLTVMVNPK